MDALLLRFGIALVAEMEDRSQRWRRPSPARSKVTPILIGIAVATAAAHGAPAVGGSSLPVL